MTKTSKKTSKTSHHGLGLILELGDDVKLIRQNISGKKLTNLKPLNLDHWIANFQEALNVPHEKYLLKDYCGAAFFRHKSGHDVELIYKRTQDGDVDGAEMFVEYGAHVGALIANLEMLFEPDTISIAGPIAKTFDAWSHAMGKARKNHLGKRPNCKIVVYLKPR